MRELLLEIWTSVRRNKLRTFLTGFSVAWGIFMLVILLGSGNGLKNGVTSNFGNYATNSIDLYGGRTSKPYMGYQKGRRIRLWNSDLEILAREFPEVDEVAANSWFDNHTATYGNEYTKVWLRGSLPKIEQIEGVEIVKGRFVNDADIREYRKSLVIDQAMQSLLFKGADPLGARIKLDSTVFTVVGVYKGDAQRSSSSCYIPLTTGQLLYNANSPEVNNAIITIKGVHTTEAMKEFEKRVIRRLSAEHHFAPDDESAIWLDNTMETYKNFMMVFAGINIFVWIIGLGTLLAGIVGVSNIMLVIVRERTQEIGVRRAIGARPWSIISQILSESFLLTFIAGILGLAAGVGALSVFEKLIAATTELGSDMQPLQISFGLGITATLIIIAGSLLAGIIPASRAMKIKAVDAIREE